MGACNHTARQFGFYLSDLLHAPHYKLVFYSYNLYHYNQGLASILHSCSMCGHIFLGDIAKCCILSTIVLHSLLGEVSLLSISKHDVVVDEVLVTPLMFQLLFQGGFPTKK